MNTRMPVFYALRFTDETCQRILASRNALPLDPAAFRPVSDDSLHMTLHFLGAVYSSSIRELSQHLETVAGLNSIPNTLFAESILFLPSALSVRVVALGVKYNSDLTAFSEALRSVVTEKPSPEQPFLPHVTLARVRKGNRTDHLLKVQSHVRDIETAHFKPFDLSVRDVTLFRSERSAEGVTYIPLSSVPVLS